MKGRNVACETEWREFVDAMDLHTSVADRMREHSLRVGEAIRQHENPEATVEIHSWLRYASETEQAARRQRSALERFIACVLGRDIDDLEVFVRTRVIPRPQDDRNVHTGDSAPLFRRDAAIDSVLTLLCGGCDTRLAEGWSDMVTGIVFRCPSCGEYSEA